MDKVDALLKQIRANGDEVWIAGPQPESAIVDLEAALGVRLPPSYRAFLARYGSLGLAGSMISGIIDGEIRGDGAGWICGDTEQFRAERGLPAHLLVIQVDEDAPYCLDTRATKAGAEFPLICYELDSEHVERLASSFGAWLVESLTLQAEE